MPVGTVVACPECAVPADVREVFLLESTHGPIEHAKVFCVRGHHFTMPSVGLVSL